MTNINNIQFSFSQTASHFLTMRLIDKAFMGTKSSPEEFFFKILGESKGDTATLRSRFFSYLADSELSFTGRETAKLAFYFLSPAMKHYGDKLLDTDAPHLSEDWICSELNSSNQTLQNWIEKLKKIALEQDAKGSVTELLDAALKDNDERFLASFYREFSIGNWLFQKIQSPKTQVQFLNYFLQILTYPVAFIVYVSFLIPDALAQRVFTQRVSQLLKESSIADWIDAAGVENKRFLTPILLAVQEAIEEVTREVGNVPKTLENIELREKLLKQIILTREAVDLFSQNTIPDLKNRIANGPPALQKLISFFDVRLAMGIESIIATLIEKSNDPVFFDRVKGKIIANLQESFQNPNKIDEKKYEFFEALQRLFATGVSKQMGSIFYNLVYQQAGRVNRMLFSPQFLRFKLEEIS